MDLVQHKTEIKQHLIEAVITALETQKLTEDQLPDIGNFIQQNIDLATTHPQLVQFTLQISSKWPIFSEVYRIEKNEETEALESEAADKMVELIQQGKIEEAIDTSKSVIR